LILIFQCWKLAYWLLSFYDLYLCRYFFYVLLKQPMNKTIWILPLLLMACAQQNVNPNTCQHWLFGRYDERLKLQNNSNYVITPSLQYDYPDTSTTIYNTTSYYEAYGQQIANPGQSLTISSRECWETSFDEIPSHKLQVFIYDASLFNKMSWDSIAAKHLYLKRYVFTEDSLKSLHWVITYP